MKITSTCFKWAEAEARALPGYERMLHELDATLITAVCPFPMASQIRCSLRVHLQINALCRTKVLDPPGRG